MHRRVRPHPIFIDRKPFDSETYIELYQIRGRFIFRFRDRKTGRFVRAKPIIRYTVIIRDVPVHERYYSVIAQGFGSEEVLTLNEEDIKDELISFAGDCFGSHAYAEEKASLMEEELDEYPVTVEEVEEIFEKINKCVLREENEDGVTIAEEEFDLRLP